MSRAAVRRVLLPIQLAIQLVAAALLAGVVAAGVLEALVDRRRRLLRVGALGLAFLGVEWAALVRLGWAWARRPARPDAYEDANRRIVCWALGALVASAGRLVGFRVRVEEPPSPAPLGGDGAVLVLARHGGLGDSFTLVWLLLARYGRTPRVVLKAALRWEPLIDVGLTRLGACFLVAGADDRAAQMAGLAAELGRRDALLVFPEGANWTARRRRLAIARFRAERKRDVARTARLLTHVLPPRPAGVLSCLEARPDLDVVVVAHTGLDKLTTVGAAWRAIPFDVPMTVRWWVPSRPPAGTDARVTWLTTEWAIIDEWIDTQTTARPV